MVDMSDNLKSQVCDVIRDSVVSVFSCMFNIDVTPLEANARAAHAPTDFICQVILRHDDLRADFHFSFDQHMLEPLVTAMYPPEALKDNFAYEDASCEIANIVCSRVKAFLNSRGYRFSMEIPFMDYARNLPDQTEEITHIHFSLKDDRFLVNFALADSADGKKAAG